MKRFYVVGLLFDPSRKFVALIRKARPDWQRGFLNGIGGKLEPGEKPGEAMAREFKEETGVAVASWEEFLVIEYPDAVLHCFRAFGDVRAVRSVTDELVGVFPVDWWHGLVPNMRWIIPFAITENSYQRVQRLQLYHQAVAA